MEEVIAEEVYSIGLDRLKTLYREARDATSMQEAEELANTAQDYYDNKQWTSREVKTLLDRRQPPIWVNRIAPAVNGVLGVLEQGQGDPRAYPRNEDDNDASEIATDSLRYVADKNRWQRVKLQASKNYLIRGVGAVLIEVDQDLDPVARIIRGNEFFFDPHSQDPDFEDARYMGIAKWMYEDAVKGMYPDADIGSTVLGLNGLGTLNDDDEDRPKGISWTDRKLRRVLLCEMYIIDEGQWKRVVFWGGGILSEEVSPYLDEQGVPANPIVAQSCYINRDNGRYGPVMAMIPIQDEINMRRSRLLHLTNSRQVKITENIGVDGGLENIRREAARADGVLPFGVDPMPTADMQQGQVLLLQEAKSEIERMGPNPAVLGQGSSSQSGRAQLVQQQAGLTELTPALGGIDDMELRVMRQFWCRIRQFWTEQKTVRVTDDIGAPKFLTVNEPIVQFVEGPVIDPQTGQQVVNPYTGEPQFEMQPQVLEVKNRPAEMDMDIIIDTTPDTANVQQEQFAELAKLAQMYGPQEVPFDDLLEISNLPKKRELIEKRQARAEQMAQGAAPEQELMQATATADIEAKAAKTTLDAAKAEGQQIDNAKNAFEMGAQVGFAAPVEGQV